MPHLFSKNLRYGYRDLVFDKCSLEGKSVFAGEHNKKQAESNP
jgi:hypothetical protein